MLIHLGTSPFSPVRTLPGLWLQPHRLCLSCSGPGSVISHLIFLSLLRTLHNTDVAQMDMHIHGFSQSGMALEVQETVYFFKGSKPEVSLDCGLLIPGPLWWPSASLAPGLVSGTPWVPGLHLGKQMYVSGMYVHWVADSGQRKKSIKCCINCCCSVTQLCPTPWTAAHQASLSFTIFQSFLKLMSIESMMPSNHLILCSHLLLPSIFPSIRVLSNESALCIRWPSIGASASVLPNDFL